MGNVIQDLCNEKLHGEGNYTWDDGVQGSGSNSRNEEGTEDDIGECDEEAQALENSKLDEKEINKRMGVGMTMQNMMMV